MRKLNFSLNPSSPSDPNQRFIDDVVEQHRSRPEAPATSVEEILRFTTFSRPIDASDLVATTLDVIARWTTAVAVSKAVLSHEHDDRFGPSVPTYSCLKYLREFETTRSHYGQQLTEFGVTIDLSAYDEMKTAEVPNGATRARWRLAGSSNVRR